MRRATGRWLTAGLAALVATVTLTACAGGADEATEPPATTTPPPATPPPTEAPLEAGTQVFAYTPSVGDCFDRRTVSAGSSSRELYLLLDCELPHQAEVFDVVEVPMPALPDDPAESGEGDAPGTTVPAGRTTADGVLVGTDDDGDGVADWPGDDAIRSWARGVCPRSFETYVGLRYELSSIELGLVMPDENLWPGSRLVACTLRDPSGELVVGSLRGAAR